MKDGCVASLISSNQLVERQDNDKTMQWLGVLISANKKPAWASDYQATIPEDARVEYLWPSAANNLSAWSREYNGEVQTLQGGWVWQALAPNKKSLRGCVDALVQKAMRVHGETDSDIFFQSEPGSNILCRNITTIDKSWQAKYNIVLAPRGNIDAEFQDWIKNLMEAYDFFLFDGSLASCSNSAFVTVFPCAFVEREQAEIAMRARDDAAIDRFSRGQMPTLHCVTLMQQVPPHQMHLHLVQHLFQAPLHRVMQ